MRTVIVCLMYLFAAGCSSGTAPRSGTSTEAKQSTAQPLSPSGQQELRAIAESGRLADLQWPNFSDYEKWVKEFYDLGNYELAWTRGGKPTTQALELIAILDDATEKGLDSKDYDGERWAGRIKALDGAPGKEETALVKFDVALTVSAMRYISDLHLGKVDPKELHREFDPERHKYDLAEFLRQRVIASPDVTESLQEVEPPFSGYRRTLAALEKYLQMEKGEKLELLAQVNKPVAPGQSYEDVEKLGKRLKLLGDLPVDAQIPAHSQAYAGDLVEAVKRFQARHGLEAAGKLGPQTIDELNRPVSFRVEQIRLTLERWRWLPHDFEEPPIIVNIPEFVLRTLDAKGNPTMKMRVVVGRAMRSETPVFQGDMKYLVFWPYWNVPPSILRNEMLPKITKDPAYLQKNGFEAATYSGQVVTDGVVSAEVLAQLRAGKLMVRQKPGLKNALGLIKFIFPNSNNVYLHSTPSQQLFAISRRDFSHGCIRVEDPAALAEWALRNNPGWTRERIDEAFKAQKEQQVNLKNTIPVLIVYGTAIAPEGQPAEFFNDIYGFDKRLEKLFANAYASQK